ncbi:MAG: hypothetical protein CMK09_12990 [Ponticaulis sp.]|nr:hypothetical protein [Ponticaulis sp.]
MPLAFISLTFPATAIAESNVVSFVSCPIYRDADAGKKSGCWLTDNPGTAQRYDVSKATSKPDWNYGVLVEGKVSDEQDNACGGVVLAPVSVSILQEKPCTRFMLPAEGYPGRPFVLPETNTVPLSVERVPPEPPFSDRTFSILFNFNDDFVTYQHGDYYVDQTIQWIRGTNPAEIIITGYADLTEHAISDYPIVEDADMAQKRAEKIAFTLKRLGVSDDLMTVQWESETDEAPDQEGADGLPIASRRRVDIEIIQSGD